MTATRTCVLCGMVHFDVRVLPVAWRRPAEHGGQLFDTVERCRDTGACRLRLEAAGGTWPVGRPDDLEAWRPADPSGDRPATDTPVLTASRGDVALAEPSPPPATATAPVDDDRDVRDPFAGIWPDHELEELDL